MEPIKIMNVRLSFPELFNASEYEKGDGKFRYRAAFIVEPGSPADKAIRAQMLAVAKDKFGAKADAILKAALAGGSKDVCYYSGDTKTYDGYEGNMVLSTSRKKEEGRPGVYDRDTSPLTEEDGKPYAGCYVNAKLDFWAQDNKNGKTIRCTLISVQFAADGDAFAAGSKPAASDFDNIAEGADAEDLV